MRDVSKLLTVELDCLEIEMKITAKYEFYFAIQIVRDSFKLLSSKVQQMITKLFPGPQRLYIFMAHSQSQLINNRAYTFLF